MIYLKWFVFFVYLTFNFYNVETLTLINDVRVVVAHGVFYLEIFLYFVRRFYIEERKKLW